MVVVAAKWAGVDGGRRPARGHDDDTVAALAGKELSPGGEGRWSLPPGAKNFDPQSREILLTLR